jgi:hypothetical protein
MKTDDSLVKGVGRLLGTATELGAALAGAVDKATAGGRESPAAPPGETPAAAIIRHSVSAAANVARWVIDTAQSARGAAGGATSGSPRANAAAGPQVQRGATLRVPLSIENPGREPMRALAPSVAGWTCGGREAAAPGIVRFVPETLDVEPRDFEKLTVLIDVDPGAAPGVYRLDVALGQGAPVSIDFVVAPAGSEQPAAR